jgi:hypothetical protein
MILNNQSLQPSNLDPYPSDITFSNISKIYYTDTLPQSSLLSNIQYNISKLKTIILNAQHSKKPCTTNTQYNVHANIIFGLSDAGLQGCRAALNRLLNY